jgi:subtilisin family serine protease
MRDHGLFIAGIIHTIAPQAELHLYEMLNPYGVASLETIAQNFLKVFKDLENKRPLFINCSFMLDIPVAGVLDKDFPPEIRNQSEFMEHLIKTPRELFGWVTQQKDVYVVAAAGNDALHNNSNGGPGRPLTRYPAAFKNVLGVGALPKNASPVNGKYSAATYSNLADHKTPPEGYMTLGGEPGPDGVLGVYIGEFPAVKAKGCLAFLWQWLGLGKARRGQLPNNFHTLVPDDIEYKLNTTGWAWWAGTSFATPIITGTLAAAILQNPGTGSPLANVAEEILGKVSQQIAATVSVPNPLTVEGEKVILVTQSAQE